MKKRALAILLTLSLSISLFSGIPVMAEESGDNLTRAGLAVIINEWLQLTDTGTESIFTDIGSCTQEQQTAINALAAEGIVSGTASGAFEPDSQATRMQAAIMVYRAWTYKGGGTDADIPAQTIFSDTTEPEYFASIINLLVYQNILTNADAVDGKFLPNDSVTEDTVRTWINRVPSPQVGKKITFNLMNEYSNSVDPEKYTVRWYQDAQLLGTGNSISVADSTAKVYYEIILSEDLAKEYTVARSGTVTLNSEESETQVSVTLEPLKDITVSGTVVDSQGIPIAGASLTFTQNYTDTYSETVTSVTTDGNGQFSAQIKNVSTVLKVSAPGYYDQSAAISGQVSGTEVDIGTISMTPLPQSRVELTVSLRNAAVTGETPATTKLSSFGSLRFSIRNETHNTDLSADAFTVQYPYIFFENGVSAGDTLSIRVEDTSGKSVAGGAANVTLNAEGRGSAEITLTENGSFVLESISGAEQTSVMLFTSDGKLYYAASAGLTYSSPSLPAGSYKLVLMEKTELLRSVSSVSELTELGFSDSDYKVMDVTISTGVITEIEKVQVPVLDQNKLFYTVAAQTGTTLSQTTAALGRYVILRIEYALKPEFNTVSASSVSVELPEGLALYGLPTVDGTAASYTGNTIQIPTGKSSGIIRVFLVANQVGEYTITPRLHLSNGAVQPIGTACLRATDALIYVPDVTSSETVMISGTTLGGSTVTVYDNGVNVGTATANAAGTWKLTYTLTNPGKYVLHEIYAEINATNVPQITTETCNLIYDAAYVDVSRVKMYNVVNGCEQVTVFDYNDPLSGASYYDVVEEDFTFAIEFKDPTRVQSVRLNVFAETGEVYSFDTVYDESTQSYTAAVSGIVPVNVGVEYLYTTPEGFDYSTEWTSTQMREALDQYEETVADVLEIKELQEWHDAAAITLGVKGSTNKDNWFTLLIHKLDYEAYAPETLTGRNFRQLEDERLFYRMTLTDNAIQHIVVNAQEGAKRAYAFTILLDNESIEAGIKVEEAEQIQMMSYTASAASSTEPEIAEFPYYLEMPIGKFSFTCVMEILEQCPIPFVPELAALFNLYGMNWMLPGESNEIMRKVTYLRERIRYLKELTDCFGLPIVSDSEIQKAETMLENAIRNEEYRYNYWSSMLENYYQKIRITACIDLASFGFDKLVDKAFALAKADNLLKDTAEDLELIKTIWDTGANIYDAISYANEPGYDIDIQSDSIDDITDLTGSRYYLSIKDAYEEAEIEISQVETYLKPLLSRPTDCPPEPQPVNATDPEKSPVPDKKIRRDPSGYVYEAVLSNRVENVITTIYYKSTDSATEESWTASEYDQANPLWTDASGYYHWDVPAGLWQVRFEKDGYQSAQSEWLPVPPPQTDINIGLVSTKAPTVEQTAAYTDQIEIAFSQYMNIDSVKTAVGLTMNGKTIACTVTALDAEYDPTGSSQYATRFSVVPATGGVLSGTVQVAVSTGAKNYTDMALGSAYSSGDLTPMIRPTGLDAPAETNAVLGAESNLRVVLEPSIQGQQLIVSSLTPSLVEIAEANSTVTTDAEGAARVILKGLLPGIGQIRITEPVSGLSSTVKVNVSTEVTQENVPENVTITLADGTAVTNGMTVPKGSQLVLNTATDDAVIRYTLNGVCPRKAGALIYSSPITITENTELQAVALKAGVFGEVTTMEIKVSSDDHSYNPVVPPTSYTITIKNGEHGKVTAYPVKATVGKTVTLTIKPDDGYKLEMLMVTDENGSNIAVTKKDGKYTFRMPNGDVNVSAAFVKEACTGGSDCPAYTYSDIDTGMWYHEAVDYVLENGLMNGIGGGKFDPNGTTSRAMLVTILWRLEGEPVINRPMKFEDVPEGTWYTEAVRWAACEGIVTGYGGTFGPMDSVTREQFATILWRYAKYKGYDVSVGETTNILSFNDAADISEWAVPALKWACGSGLMKGDGVKLTPTAGAARCQSAALLMRFCKLDK